MRYEGVTLARASAALIFGLVIVSSGCGRAPVALSPNPASQVTPSTAPESPADSSGPFNFAPSGQLPPGTTLNGLALAGQFTTTSAGPFTFDVTVTDALGATGAVKAAFNVFPHRSLRGGTFTQKVGIAFTVALPYSMGTPGGIPKVALAKGGLPLGSVLSIDPKLSQVVISVPAQRLAGSYLSVLVLTDSSPCSANATCATSANVTINLG